MCWESIRIVCKDGLCLLLTIQHKYLKQVNFLQSIDYHYNVRNWLVRINDLYQVSPASIDPVPSSLSVLEKRINEIVLKYNS
ncbi:MAG: hypothetical protein JKY03_12095 [Aureispira sp.]|nr:hypothetical protein [Aureispira sp.]